MLYIFWTNNILYCTNLRMLARQFLLLFSHVEDTSVALTLDVIFHGNFGLKFFHLSIFRPANCADVPLSIN